MNQGFVKHIFCPALILFFSLGLVSCSKKLSLVATPAAPPSVDVEEINFGYMHGRARLVYKDEKKEREVKAHIRVRKDSVIWMQFSVIGVQGGKALINKDSITIVSNIDREYFVFTYKELSEKFHFEVNYHVIESAILGNLFQPKAIGDELIQNGPFDVLLQSQKEIKIKNSINRGTKKIERVELSEPTSSNSLNILYSDFQPLGDRSFPYNNLSHIIYSGPTGKISTSITVEFNKAEVGDKELKFPFHIPRKYDRR